MKSSDRAVQNISAFSRFLSQPIILFTAVWGSVYLLYSMHLSKLLLYTNQQVFGVIAAIWVPLVSSCLVYAVMRNMAAYLVPSRAESTPVDLDRLDRRLTLWFRIWIGISAIEIVVSGGIPIIWLVIGSSKTYMDFGIPSLHGPVNALLTVVAIGRFALYLLTGQRRHLKVPIFILFWSLIVITRNLMLVALAEYAILFVMLRGIRVGTLLRIIASFLAIIFVFGVVGDLRSGAEAFRLLAQPNDNYPDWLPSGVLWAYMYITTPVNNLVHTILSEVPAYDWTFPNTSVSLFPTVIRTAIYGQELGQSISGNLVTDAFNVSTAYIGPAQDFGYGGMMAFSALTGLACQVFFYGRQLRAILVYAVLAQCLVMTLFFNHFFALPIIAQILWIYLLFCPEVRLA